MDFKTRDGSVKQVDIEKFVEAYNSQLTNDQIAFQFGITRSRLWELSRRLNLPSRYDMRKAVKRCERIVDPTEDEIRERAAAIRATWSAAEEERRAVGRQAGRREIRSYTSHCTKVRSSLTFKEASTIF